MRVVVEAVFIHIGHVHGGALGWVGGMAFAALYYLVPRLWNAPLHSEKLANTHFWIATLGILVYYVSMWASGIAEGLMWRATDASGALQYPEWVQITKELFSYRFLRGVGGVLFLGGFLLMAYNLYKTMKNKGAGFVRPDLREEADSSTPASSADMVVQ